ncbi:AraC family transcriptional regulator [Dickeya zeae]|uniref:AraC family transcriptional regulator n=1 Tax=Dickeya zeae TaxID=204042 RepID=UPI00143FE167|nr:AraC family transcriptional regulator [Dickeya zeae]QIZ47167.1 AraC family transcriptional regulator [Dickeya zeae]
MINTRDNIKLWKDSGLFDGTEILQASCFEHSYPPHFHEEFVIAAFARGAQKNRICRDIGVATAGTVMVIHPGEIHTGEAFERDKGWDYCALYPSEKLLNKIADTTLKGHGYLHFGKGAMRHDQGLARQLIHTSTVLLTSDDILEKECTLFGALSCLIRQYGKRSGDTTHRLYSRADIRDAIDYLQDMHDKKVSVKDVATAVGMSEFHFMRVFQATTGLSVHRYLTQIRLFRAKALLSQGVSAIETAHSAGFFDQSHLIKNFRSHFGITPGAYAAGCIA